MKSIAALVFLVCIGGLCACDSNPKKVDSTKDDDQQDLTVYIQNSDSAYLNLVAHYFDLIKGKRVSDTLEFAEDGAASISLPSVLSNTYRNLYLVLNSHYGWSILMKNDLKLVV
ncbi:MAG: hypothetical protein ACPGLV_14745, partial [Bacteroidia bacterium]